jgi:hypothetical protein
MIKSTVSNSNTGAFIRYVDCALKKKVATEMQRSAAGISKKKHRHTATTGYSISGLDMLWGTDGHNRCCTAVGHPAVGDIDVENIVSSKRTAPSGAG